VALYARRCLIDVKEAIEKRRAYRALAPVEITDGIIGELAEAALLTASCFNNQPWKFIFVRSKDRLEKVHAALGKNNDWVKRASCIIAAFANKDYDCVIKEREYYLFDLGMAVSAMQLRATELGLVAHPIAGFEPEAIKQSLGIPQEFNLITIINVGKKSEELSLLTPFQAEQETGGRPKRLMPESVYSIDGFDEKLNIKPQK
jgi:nitroreductase